MPQDRLIELATKEFIAELTAEEVVELDLLLRSKPLKDKYEFLKLYLSNNYDDHSSDEAIFKKIQQKISQHEVAVSDLKVVRRWPLYWKAAVAAIFIIASASIFSLYRNQSPAQQIAHTKRASKSTLILSDGTKVTLNAESKLVYPAHFSGKNREVTLVGEGFFDVVKDSEHPFIIHTSKMDIKVLGTAFNVKAYADDRFSETSLLRGLIEVTLKDRPSDRIILKPFEKLIVRNKDLKLDLKNQRTVNDPLTQVTRIQKSDTTIIETSWIDNKVVFNEQSFADIAKMLERVYDVHIEFRSEELKNLKFTGFFNSESISYVLQTLSMIEPFSYKIENQQILITPTQNQ